MLNDKALCKLMRRTYKAGGVKVYRNSSILYLDGGFWVAGFVWADVPAKILALLAEWLRKLPGPGEGWHCLDGVPADEFVPLEAPGENVQALLDKDTREAGNLKFTPVVYDAARLATTDSGGQFWFDEESRGVLGTRASAGFGRLLVCPNDSQWGRWIDLENYSTLWLPVTERGLDRGVIDILARYDFWKGEKR